MQRTIDRCSGRLLPQNNPTVITSCSDISVFVGRNPTNRANMPQHDEHIPSITDCRLPIQTRFTVRASAEKQSRYTKAVTAYSNRRMPRMQAAQAPRIQPKSLLRIASYQFKSYGRFLQT